VLIFTMLGTTLLASNYYVSGSGSDSNPGSLTQPWRSVQKAASTLSPGDTVLVRSGTYAEAVKVTVSGSPTGGWVTFSNYPGETPVLDGTSLSVPLNADAGLFLMNNCSWVVIQGFELRNFHSTSVSATPSGIFLRGACSSIQIRNCNIHGISNTGGNSTLSGNAFGIAVYGSSITSATNIVIDSNEIHDCKTGSSETLTLNGNVSNFQVTNNLVHDNNNIGIDFIGFEGTCTDPTQDQARSGVCSGNTVWNISSQGNQAYASGDYSADGIYVDGGTGILIERNITHDNDIGFELASEHSGKVTSQIILRDNLVWACRQSGLLLGGYDSTTTGGTDGCTVTNNTFWNNDTLQWGNGELQLRWRTSNCVFRNNLFFNGAENTLVTIPVSAANNVNNSFDYNLYECAAGSALASWSWNNQACTGFAAWKSASGKDANARFADPKFIATGTSPNLHLQLNSPAIDAGDPAFTAAIGESDIDSNPRVTGGVVDIGADELTPIDHWRVANFGVNATQVNIAGDTANPARDGIVNLLKYALGLNPLKTSQLPNSMVGMENGYLTLTVSKNPEATDVSLVAESTGELAANLWSNSTTTTLLNDTGTFMARDNVSINSASRRFIRLRVTHP